MAFTEIDFIFILVIILFAIIGVIKGFIYNVFGKLSWSLGILGAFFLYKQVVNNVFSGMQNVIVANILAFFILFIIIFLIVKMVQIIFERMFEFPVLNSLDRVLGCLFGIVEGVAIVTLFIFLLSNQSFFDNSNLSEGSFFFNLFKKFSADVNIQQIQELTTNV